MNPNREKKRQIKLFAAASAASIALVSSALGQSNVGTGQVVISTAGSTALKNWFVAKTTTFTDVQPETTLTINGISYPTAGEGGVNYWQADGGPGLSYQLAPKANTTNTSGGPTDQSAAVQFVYHESGSVEGVYELANDQLYTNSDYASDSGIPSTSIPFITATVDRNPEGGNAVWLNYNQIGASGVTAGAGFNATTGSAPAGTTVTLGNFYGPGVGQAGTPGVTTLWVPGSANNPTPTFNQAGVNLNGGQNAVQLALSDAVPQQIFANNYGNTSNTYIPAGSLTPQTETGVANTSFNSNPLDLGYGSGNPALPTGSPGKAGIRTAYQSAAVLDMPATAQNPRAAQGTTFGVGPWNNATDGGLGNLNSQLTAITATAFVANPGTGLTQLDRTDADWLQLTGRLKNGAAFNTTTRDVNSGTHDVAALDTGVDPTYAVGKNDDGNGNLPNAVSNNVFDQESIGAAQRFSNKTAGGAQLRPTVQNNRMAIGTLSINDASGNDTQGVANPVRVLSYSDSVDGSAPYVSPNYATITTGAYAIYQNEQVVTIRDPDANYATNTVVTAANGAQIIQGQVLGDDASGDVVALLNNTANSVATANAASSPLNPADGLLSQGYIIPSLMQVTKNLNGQGLNNSAPGEVDTGSIVSQSNLPANGGNFDAALYAQYTAPGGFGPTALPDLTTQQPTTGTGSTYGGKGGTFAKNFFNGGAIPITADNFLFGNFNQNGVRDFNAAVKSGLAADRALITADQAVGASVPGSEFTSQGDNNGVAGGTNGIANTANVTYADALGIPHTITKGSLIVMGDYLGSGHFDGASLVAIAEDAALSDNTDTDRLTIQNYQTGVLDKNAALDYLNASVGTTGADLYIRQSGRAVLEGAAIPAGATAVLNPITGAPVLDPVTGLADFTYDPNGTNTFNKSDVNQDGVVDLNDAIAVDNANGKDFANLTDTISATIPAPVTGVTIPLNLVLAKQSDGSTVIDASDVAVVNSALTGSGNSNLYGFTIQKTGPATVTFARTGGTVTVYPGAAIEVSGGTLNVAGTIDPFSDNNSSGPTVGNHAALTIDSGAKVTLAPSGGRTYTIADLSIATASGASLDVGDNELDIGGSPANFSKILGLLVSGRNGGTWTGAGINSSVAAAGPIGRFSVGYLASTDSAGSAGQTVVRYVLTGDAFLEGSVGFDDLVVVAQNFGFTGQDWSGGNFDYDPSGSVGFTDLVSVAQNFGFTSGGSVLTGGSAATISPAWQSMHNTAVAPEPGSLGLIAAGVAGLLTSRRRRAGR